MDLPHTGKNFSFHLKTPCTPLLTVFCSHHVADAVLWSVDHCTRPDQSVAGKFVFIKISKSKANMAKGFQAATGNGDLIVGSTSKQYIGTK